MRYGGPWRVRGIRAETRDTAREAARRSGLSVGEWLDAVVLESAAEEGVRAVRRPYYPEEDAESDRHADDLSSVHERLDEVARHLGRLSRTADAPRPAPGPASMREARPLDDDLFDPPPPPPVQVAGIDQVTDAISRLDRRLDQLILETRAATPEPAPAPAPVMPTAFVAPHFAAPYFVAPSFAAPAAPFAPPAEPHRAYAPPAHRQPPQAFSPAPAASSFVQPAATSTPTSTDWRDGPLPNFAAPPARPWMGLVDDALAEIKARQQILDADPPPAAQPAMPMQNLQGLEQHLRHITEQIAAIRSPALEQSIESLRDELREIARSVLDAVPRRSIEALEHEIKNLIARVDNSRNAGIDEASLAALERGLEEIRQILRTLTPAENLGGIAETVTALARKIDGMDAARDSTTVSQLEESIRALREIVAHVASNDALTQLTAEVRGLGARVEDIAGSRNSADVLATLEHRIAFIADALEARAQNGDSVPPQLEAVIKGLSDKIERVQVSAGNNVPLGQLEERIVKLVEKLDASGARLANLEAIERGLADILSYLEGQRGKSGAAAETLQRNLTKTQDSLEAVHGTLSHVVSRIAMLEKDIHAQATQGPQATFAEPPADRYCAAPAADERSAATAETRRPPIAPPLTASKPMAAPEIAAPTAPALPQAGPAVTPPTSAADMPRKPVPPQRQAPRAPTQATAASPAQQPSRAAQAAAQAFRGPANARPPIDPNLPPDHPLEPGHRGLLTGNGPGGTPAARIAASEAALGGARSPVIADPTGKANFIEAARRAARTAAAAEPASDALRPMAEEPLRPIPGMPGSADGRSTTFTGRVKSLLVGASVVILIGAAVHLGLSLLHGGDGSANSSAGSPQSSATAGNKLAAAEPREGDVVGALGTPSHDSIHDTPRVTPKGTADASARTAAAPPPLQPLDGQTTVPATRPAAQAGAPVTGDMLPDSIGGTPLRTAALAGDAAAQYEVGSRYAEGRGVPLDLAAAARWLDRAARQGIPLAQFRLANLYEKGTGVTKDIETARKLYLQAAAQENAKAMHNLAVLYAEGIKGKPDYQNASLWFRRAADYGVSDSQYNLGILCARGIGVAQNLGESYKWFSLAAAQGDRDAAKKRDDVAKKLDYKALENARRATQEWVLKPQPSAAVVVRSPPGGWDGPDAAARPATPIRLGAR